MLTAVASRQASPARSRLVLPRHGILLAVLVAAGFALRLALLADKSVWLDEASSIAISNRSAIDVLRMVIRTDPHPPFYYLLLSLWLPLGSGDGHVRLLSALFSVASIPLIYYLAKAIYEGVRAGLIAAAILAFSPFQIWYAQEARMYAMLTFLVLASALFFVLALRRGSALDWVGFVLATTLALYTNYGAIWYLMAISLFYLSQIKRFPRTFLGWALSYVAITVLYAAWLPTLWKQTRQMTEGFWVASLPPPTFQTVLGTFLDFNSFNFPWMGVAVIYIGTVFVLSYIVPYKEGWQRPLVTLWLFAPLGISLVLSLRQPIFLSRNLIVASLGYYLLVTGTILRFRSRKTMIVLLLPLLAMNLISIGHKSWRAEKENWRATAAYVAQEARGRGEGLIVFVPSYAELPFMYYFQQYGLAMETQGYPEDEFLLHPDPKKVTTVEGIFDGRPAVWLVLRGVTRDVKTVDPEGTVMGWLDSHGHERTGNLVIGDLMVISYVR